MIRAAMIACAAAARLAHASPETDAADRLLDEGVQLASRGELARACERFTAARELRDDVRARGLEAGCNEKLGRSATAWRGYQRLRELADRAGDRESAAFAAAALARLRPRLARLRIDVAPARRRVVVSVDGHPWAPAAWGRQVEIDPGDHLLHVDGPGMTSAAARIAIRDGEHVQRWVEVTRDRARSRRRALGQIALACGGAAVAAGAAFGARAIARWGDARAAGCTPDGRCPDAAALDLLRAADRSSTASTWMIGGGLALALGGGALWLTARPLGPARWTITPSVTADARGALVSLVVP